MYAIPAWGRFLPADLKSHINKRNINHKCNMQSGPKSGTAKCITSRPTEIRSDATGDC